MAALEPAYLALGTDSSKVRNVVARLRSHFDEDAVDTVQAAATPAEELLASTQMLGLLASSKLYVVQGAEDWKAPDVDAILAWLKAPPPDVTVLLLASKLAANSRLRKAFAKPRLIDCSAPEKPDQVIKWAVQRFAQAGVEVAGPVAAELVRRAGHDSLDRLASDIDRIVTYAGNDMPVDVELVARLATTHDEEKVWALTDAWASRDRGALLRMSEQLMGQEASAHPVQLVGILARHLRYVHMARRMLERSSPSQVQQALADRGVRGGTWVARRYVEQAQRIGLAHVDAALARVAQLEAELKGASTLGSGKVAGNRDASAIVLQRGLAELV